MAIYRSVHLSFWTDNKVEDDFTPEDKYFYLYLLTNPQTNICGCYEVSWSQLTTQTGYNKDTLIRLINRFENTHKIIKFNKDTKEMLILNWYKYNWSKSEKTLVGVENVAKHIKCKEFKKYIFDVINNIENGNFDMPPLEPMQTSDTAAASEVNINTIKDIILYLNNKLNTNYKYTSKANQKYIRARLNDGHTIDDFKTVIDKKYNDWNGTDMAKFLRPETLFGPKFDSYLNQKDNEQVEDEVWGDWGNE